MTNFEKNYSENIFLEDIYLADMQKINGITFTRREIDLIACLMSGKNGKKIASLLSISPRTVEAHIRNIMLKLGCNSQNNIIDFIEKSKKFDVIKKYYAILLIKNKFELELKKIGNMINKEEGRCLIVVSNEMHKKRIISQLEQHLKLANIHSTVIYRSQQQNLNLFDKENNENQKHINYIFDIENLNESGKKDGSITKEIFDFIQATKLKQKTIIFIQLDTKDTIHLKEMGDFNCIRLESDQHYYMFVFELLSKMFKINIESNIANFIKQNSIMFDLSSAHMEINNILLNPQKTAKTKTQNTFILKERRKLFYIAGACLSLFCAIFLFFYLINIPSKHLLQNILVKKTTNKTKISLVKQLEKNEPERWNLPRHDHLFIGRQQLLQDLRSKLHSEFNSNSILNMKSNSKLAIIACEGLGGIGKTQLALQYAHNAQYPYSLRAWFPAEFKNQLQQKYLEFSKELGYVGEPSIEAAISYVNSYLANHPGWLIVFDNARNYQDISQFIPENGGFVIITSRHRDWPTNFKTLSIDVMSEKEAIELFKAFTNRNIEDEIINAKKLIKALGALPLALTQACAYIKQNQISIDDYLKLYEKYELELLENAAISQGTHDLPVAITWNISLTAIAKEAQSEKLPLLPIELLTVCSYLGPEKISREFLLHWFKKAYPNVSSPELLLNNQIRRLWLYSMIKFDSDEFISIHRLVQSVLRHQHTQSLKNKNLSYPMLSIEWYEKLLRAGTNLFQRSIQMIEQEHTQTDLLPHLLSLIHYYEKLWGKTENLHYAEVLHDIGYICYYYLGKSERGKTYLENALNIKERYYGLNKPEIILLLTDLGIVYKELGNVSEAKEILEKALNIRKNYHSLNHPQTAVILTYLSTAYRELGDSHKAREMAEQALLLQEKNYGTHHFEAATSLSALGIAYRDLGDINKAKEVLERALKLRAQHYGNNHYKTAISMTSLGIAYRELGDLESAKKLLEDALRFRNNYYGLNHYNSAINLTHLGIIYRNLGDFNKSKEIMENAYEIRKQHYGKNHFITAFTQAHLGITYQFLKDYKKAIELLTDSLEIKEQHYGTDHPEVAFNLSALGEIHLDIGNLEEAQALLKRALKIQKQFFGENHSTVVKTQTILSKCPSKNSNTLISPNHVLGEMI